MIQDTQEYLQHWEKENNPFYPNEMRWDRLQVNIFLKEYKQQLILPVVSDMLCGSFDADNRTSSATKCKCGREKWEHPKPRD
jgi:hypothetical protein